MTTMNCRVCYKNPAGKQLSELLDSIELAPPQQRSFQGRRYAVDDDILVYASETVIRRAKVIKINKTGITCKYYAYKCFRVIRTIEGQSVTNNEYYWINKLEDKKIVIRNMNKVDNFLIHTFQLRRLHTGRDGLWVYSDKDCNPNPDN